MVCMIWIAQSIVGVLNSIEYKMILIYLDKYQDEYNDIHIYLYMAWFW